jgi:TRAP transporter 4TM/12TM fusion protein
MGMISGSTVANVASTGAITIKLMKRFGFSGEKAGAIEAVASTGGQFAPPIMGLTAFLIVGMTGIPYSQVMLAAIFPAIIYFGALLVAVQLYANKSAVHGGEDAEAALAEAVPDMSMREAVRAYGHVLVSVAVLVALLVMRLPAPQSALAAVLTLMGTEILKQIWSNWRAPLQGLKTATISIARGLEAGARDGAQLAIVIAVIGILVDILVVTGFAQKLSYVLLSVAGDQLWFLLIMTAIACIVFGLGMPTPAAYILVALLGVPALLNFGVPLLAAHMFVFFFANMSAITPPIAVASLVASKIAEADYLKTSFASLWLGLPGFILPFVFIDSPQILGIGGNFAHQLYVFAVAFIAVISANIAFIGFITRPLALWQRAVVLCAAAGLLFPSGLASLAGAILLLLGLAPEAVHIQRLRRIGTRNLGDAGL